MIVYEPVVLNHTIMVAVGNCGFPSEGVTLMVIIDLTWGPKVSKHHKYKNGYKLTSTAKTAC